MWRSARIEARLDLSALVGSQAACCVTLAPVDLLRALPRHARGSDEPLLVGRGLPVALWHQHSIRSHGTPMETHVAPRTADRRASARDAGSKHENMHFEVSKRMLRASARASKHSASHRSPQRAYDPGCSCHCSPHSARRHSTSQRVQHGYLYSRHDHGHDLSSTSS